MPTYEYQCGKCEKVFDIFHGMSEEGPKRCQDPECNGKLKKLISAGSGLIFKGSGFYITDYKNKSGKADKTGETESKPKEGAAKTAETSETSESSGKNDSSSGASDKSTKKASGKKDSTSKS